MKIAICGAAGTGKTTLAEHMAVHHGWSRIGYNDLLKEWLATSLSNYAPEEVTVEDIIENKEKYRNLLQLFGDAVGFNEGNGVEQAHEEWAAYHNNSVIFDNVRFQAQYERLKPYGFVLVELVREQPRSVFATDVLAKALGMYTYTPKSVLTDQKAAAHPAEHQKLVPDFTLNATGKSVEDVADILLRLEGKQRKVRYDRAA